MNSQFKKELGFVKVPVLDIVKQSGDLFQKQYTEFEAATYTALNYYFLRCFPYYRIAAILKPEFAVKAQMALSW